MRFLRFFTLFLGFVAAAASGVAAGGAPSNAIRVSSTKGAAVWTNPPAGGAVALQAGQLLPEGAAISTEAGASVTLEFANGATVALGESSELVISKFSQEALAAASVADAREPAVSVTELTLTRGTVTNKVSRLAKGSSYNITTPVGAAGVRGTTFQVSYDPAENTLRVLTLEGFVVFTSLNNQEFPVTAGQSLTLEFDVGADGTITLGNVIQGALTPDEIVVIQAFLEAIPADTFTNFLSTPSSQTILSDDVP